MALRRSSISRRRLVKGGFALMGTALLASAGAAAFCARRDDAAGTAEASAPERLALALENPAGARRIGAGYLRRYPEENDPARLARWIEEGADVVDVRCPATAARALAAAARRDFVEGRIVQFDGWVMARTELRLCAWLAVHAPCPAQGERLL